MKTMFLMTLAAAALAAGTASAADLAARTYTKAPMAPAAVAYDWSGFYAGVMGGYSWSSRLRTDGIVANSNELKGGFGGGTVGYNWQSPGSSFVWGLEVDAAGGSIGADAAGVGFVASEKINAFGSVTGRLGVAAGAALFYVKGGYGWANNRLSGVDAVLGAYSETRFHSGWTAGGGVEYMFAPNWSLKGEYMYADYNNQTYGNPTIGFSSIGSSFHSVKAGLNYHFNSPVVARY